MSKKSFTDANTQTIIRVHPHLLDIDQVPKVSADSRLGTVLSIAPQDETHFYSLLRYTPFPDIKETCIRVLDIQRAKKLQFHSLAESQEMQNKAKQFSLADDDGVGYICCSLIKRDLSGIKTAYFDIATQTDVSVFPHVLKEDEVALVFDTKETQTSSD